VRRLDFVAKVGGRVVVAQDRAPLVCSGERACVLGRVFHWILVATFVLPVAACTIGPDFTAPIAPLADKFRDVDNRSVKSDPLEYERWWEGFRDPTLNKLIQIAYNQNLTLLSAGTRVLQARAVLGVAIGVSYPQVQQGAARLSTTAPARLRRSRAQMRRRRISGPMPLPRKRPGNWIFGANFGGGSNPPMVLIWLRSLPMTTFWSRFWVTLPRPTSVSAPQSS
jgi:hypothetical protein